MVQKGVSLAGTMETPRGGFDESGEPNPAAVRWVAPVDPVTGAVDTRLCFVYADLWRRVLSPEAGELEPLQAWGASEAEESRAGTYECVCISFMTARVFGLIESTVGWGTTGLEEDKGVVYFNP